MRADTNSSVCRMSAKPFKVIAREHIVNKVTASDLLVAPYSYYDGGEDRNSVEHKEITGVYAILIV